MSHNKLACLIIGSTDSKVITVTTKQLAFLLIVKVQLHANVYCVATEMT